MKPALIALIALPALSIVAGYAGGMVLAPEAESVASDTAEPELTTPAEDLLAAAGADEPGPDETSDAKADPAGGDDPEAGYEKKKADSVVKLGRLTVPVYKPRSVTYVVADFGVSVPDTDTLSHYSIAENAARLRDAILASLTEAASGTLLSGPAIDSDALSEAVKADLIANFHDIDEVLFLGLYKTDVPRS